MILGLTFKENTPDLRNTRVVDVVAELEEYGMNVDVHDPWADPAEAKEYYGIDLVAQPDAGAYDGIVLAVAHRQFKQRGAEGIRSWGRPAASVFYDLKYAVAAAEVDLRL